ncbi:MAG: arylsulfatase [Acidobacteria bacterium]|nr:arylsulfatase [Acidobacteriota bacterium]
MNRRTFLQSAGAALACHAAAATEKKPNIVLILADDMGFSDLGCYGGEIRTPNIDGLARAGVRFTQFYNTARCCPTRASLLTGLYPHQAAIGHMVDNPKPFPGYRGDLSRRAVTIAEALKPAGYQTLMAGKWHVTPVTESKHNWPRQRGFDRYYGIIHGAADYFNPVTLVRDNEKAALDGPNYYFTDAIADNASKFIADAAAKPEPYFLYAAFTAPHWPLHAREEDIARYRGRYKDGWDVLREERHKRQIAMGIVSRKWPVTPRDSSVKPWSEVADKEWQQRRMEVYAAQVDRLDQAVGRILDAIKRTGQEENTLVMFLADNGGCAEELGPRAKALHIPGTTLDGKPVKVGNVPGVMPGSEETYQSYGLPWANASNTPFRLYKHWVHEGGISTPLIARWPKVIRKTNSLTNEPGHLIDLMATCVDVAGARYPESFAGERIVPLEGKSLKPVFEKGKRAGHEAIFWEHEGNRAIRQGRWKLVSRHPGKWELYDVEADRTEMQDLAAKQPDRVAKMSALYDQWAIRAQIEPWQKVVDAPRGAKNI